MDITALLAESNKEAAADDSAYDTDEFEDDAAGAVATESSTKEEKIALLKAAAAKVAVEEKRVADRVFHEMAGGIADTIKAQKQAEVDPESILANASRTVNEHYNRQDPSAAHKFQAVEEKGSDDEDEDEGEDDEDEDAGDAQLNEGLLFAVFNERLEAVKTALRKGANYFMRDRHGWTPLHWAAAKGYADIMEALIDHAKVNNKNVARYINSQDTITGWTPLHAACVGGHLHAVEVLLRYKARKNKLNKFMEKPSDCLGKSAHPRQIRQALGVPLKPAAGTTGGGGGDGGDGDGDDDHHDDHHEDVPRGLAREESKDGSAGARYGGIPSGRSAGIGRPPIGNSGAYVVRYERGNNFSDDGSYQDGARAVEVNSDRSHREEKDRR